MNRLSLFSIGLYLLLAVGFFTLNGTLVSLAIPLAVYLMAALLQSPEALKLEATRRLSATCAGQEMPVEVTLEIRNLGGHLDEIEVHDDLPGGLQLVAGETGVRTRLANGERVTLQYTIKARRGRYAFHTVRATAVETSGLFRRVSLLRVPGNSEQKPK